MEAAVTMKLLAVILYTKQCNYLEFFFSCECLGPSYRASDLFCLGGVDLGNEPLPEIVIRIPVLRSFEKLWLVLLVFLFFPFFH